MLNAHNPPLHKEGWCSVAFDIATLLDFQPAHYWCLCCHTLWKNPVVEMTRSKDWTFLRCKICKTTYRTTKEFHMFGITRFLSLDMFDGKPLTRIPDLFAHSMAIAEIANRLKSKKKEYPPFRALMQSVVVAKAFIHFVSWGISPMTIGMLKLISQQVSVRGIVAGNVGEQIISEVTDYQNEAPGLEIRFWKHNNFRGVDEPHQKLIVIDGLIAFRGSANLTHVAWRSALNDMDDIEAVTDVDEVIMLHNRFYSALWAKSAKPPTDSIVMTSEI
jgi:hypothetical protein